LGGSYQRRIFAFSAFFDYGGEGESFRKGVKKVEMWGVGGAGGVVGMRERVPWGVCKGRRGRGGGVYKEGEGESIVGWKR